MLYSLSTVSYTDIFDIFVIFWGPSCRYCHCDEWSNGRSGETAMGP